MMMNGHPVAQPTMFYITYTLKYVLFDQQQVSVGSDEFTAKD